MLDFYAERSPVFMAAKFDANRAAELGQTAGDSTPIMATIPTDDPWVPLRILGLGLDGNLPVEADVFLLTDEQPELLAGGPGLTLSRSEAASTPDQSPSNSSRASAAAGKRPSIAPSASGLELVGSANS